MRLYYVVSGIFLKVLILSVIDFAVAAPTLVQEKVEKPQAQVDAVGNAEDAMTTLRKRVGDWEEVWQMEVINGGRPGSHFFLKKPSSGARLMSTSQRPGPAPADGWTNLKQPLPTIPEEPPSLTSKTSKLLMSKLAK